MKFCINVLVILLTFSCFAQETIRIPDVALEEALIDLKIDTNGLNGTILVSDARYVVNLNVSDPLNNKDLPNVHSKIKDLTGIEHFQNLKRLDCYGNAIHTINLTKNTELSFLNCSDNKIRELDLSNNPNLYFISCDSNKITSLKLGSKPKLTELYCNVNRLTKLNLKECYALETIDISNNKIDEVLVSSTAVKSIPKGWYKDNHAIYVTAFGAQPVQETTKVTSIEKPIKATIKKVTETEPITYNETFKQMVVKEFEKKVLNEKYLQLKKQEILQRHNLDPEKLTAWIQQYSKFSKLNE